MKITRRQLKQIITEMMPPRGKAGFDDLEMIDNPTDSIPPEDHLPLAADVQIDKMTDTGHYSTPGGPPKIQAIQRKAMKRKAASDPQVFRVALSAPFGQSSFAGRAFFIGDKRVTGQSEAAIEHFGYDSESDAMNARQMARFAYQLGATHILDDNFGEEPALEKYWYPLPLKTWVDIVEPRMEAYKKDFAMWVTGAREEAEREREESEREERERSKFPFEVLPGGRDD